MTGTPETLYFSEEEGREVTCWNCGRKILSASGFISCTCGCTQAASNGKTSCQPGFDPDFAARMSSPA